MISDIIRYLTIVLMITDMREQIMQLAEKQSAQQLQQRPHDKTAPAQEAATIMVLGSRQATTGHADSKTPGPSKKPYLEITARVPAPQQRIREGEEYVEHLLRWLLPRWSHLHCHYRPPSCSPSLPPLPSWTLNKTR